MLKIIKDGTDIYPIALCGKLGHVDATITLCQACLAGRQGRGRQA